MNNTFVLRAAPSAQPSCDALADRLQGRGVRVLDRSDRMLLVQADEVMLALELAPCVGWSLVPHTVTALPSPPPLPTRKSKSSAASKRTK